MLGSVFAEPGTESLQGDQLTPVFNSLLSYLISHQENKSIHIQLGGGTVLPTTQGALPKGMHEAMVTEAAEAMEAGKQKYPTASAGTTKGKVGAKAFPGNKSLEGVPMFTKHILRAANYTTVYRLTKRSTGAIVEKPCNYIASPTTCPKCATKDDTTNHNPRCWCLPCQKCGLYGHQEYQCHQDPACYSTGTFISR